MSAAASGEPAPRHLRVVDSNGEVIPEHPEITKLKADRKNLERELRAKRRRIAELEADKALEREEYARRADVERIHSYWKRKCRPDRVAALTPARFDAVRGILDQQVIVAGGGRKPAYELADFKRAIDGIAFDHFKRPRKNGTVQHFDDLELCCRDGKQFEEFMRRAPRPLT